MIRRGALSARSWMASGEVEDGRSVMVGDEGRGRRALTIDR